MHLQDTLKMIDHLIAAEKWPDAEFQVRRTIAILGPLDPLRGRLAAILAATGDSSQALDIVESLMPVEGTLELVRVLLLYRLRKLGEGREAMESACGHIDKFPVDDVFDLARELYEEGFHDPASDLLSSTLPMVDEDVERKFHALTGLALCAAARGSADALDLTETALFLRTEDPLLLSVKANLLIDAGKRHEGLGLLEKLGPDVLTRLQSDVGLKRLLRARRRRDPADSHLRQLEDAVHRLSAAKQWQSMEELFWAECASEDSRQCLFLADCPDSGRLVGYAYNPEVSAAPLVSLAVQGQRRLLALEESRFWGIPVHVDGSLVDRHFSCHREKVVEEPSSSLWDYLRSAAEKS